jgi:hypothetical protein
MPDPWTVAIVLGVVVLMGLGWAIEHWWGHRHGR